MRILVGILVLVERKTTFISFFRAICFDWQLNMFRSYLFSLFLRWVALLSVHNLKIHNLQLHGQNPSSFTRVPFSRVWKVSCRDDNVAAYLSRNFIAQSLGRSSSSAYEKWSFCAKRMTRANVLAGGAIFGVVIAYAYFDLFRFYFCFYFFDLNWKENTLCKSSKEA